MDATAENNVAEAKRRFSREDQKRCEPFDDSHTQLDANLPIVVGG